MAPRPRKQFGQHWLRSEKILHQIVAAAELKSDNQLQGNPTAAKSPDRILEIGPGTGLLTRQLLPQAQAVVAVEIDFDLCRLLVEKFKQAENFLLLQGDFLTLDLQANLAPFPSFQNPNKVVANIPYYITGPILEKLLGTITKPAAKPFDSIVLLVQKEVADRLYARPGSRNFGALSVRVQYLAECELVCPVPAKAFHPPPKVDSAVVRLKPRPTQPAADNPQNLEILVKAGFATKRKMLRNNLKSLVDRDRLTSILEELALNPQARAEDLGVAEWVALSNRL